ncbi:DUF3299 domain-containing protein [Microbulbifer flavimaris]|uniref:DUF3299 domain-containing protein n=2 Tax=Microbulbiferaceae TaxID=1706373 RepID=A0ABX4I3W5_9GAMM|nr:DUF3299 domain-containing protein [Microbulbifer flavimaris]
MLLAAAVSSGCSEAEKAGEATAEQAVNPSATEPAEQQSDAATVEYREVQWEELIPKDDLDALLNPPDYLANIVEGSEQDIMPAGPASGSEVGSTMDRYQQAMISTKIKPEFDRQQVRIPGFVVPLEFDDNQTITSFLLVPFFGACIHLPPPPPNQVVYAEFPEGFQVNALYDPFYIEGELRTLLEETAQGTAAYSMKVKRVYPYD